MSDSEDFEQLKVIELQNELKKRGLDTKGRKMDLIDRLRQAMNNETESDPTKLLSSPNNDESAAAIINDDASSSTITLKDQDTTSGEANFQTMEDFPYEEQKSPSSKKRHLNDDKTEKGEDNEDNLTENSNNDIEKDDEIPNDSDDLSKQTRKKRSRWGSEQDEDSPEQQSTPKQTSDNDDNNDEDDNHSSRHADRDYHRSSRQHDDDRHYSSRYSEKSTEREIPLPEEETVQFNNEDVVLDFYTSDLNLTVNTDCLSASNKSNDALCFLWAGVRGTYGFRQGRICYEIRITEIIDCPQMPESEKEKFGIRIGWSNLSSSLQLGEFNGSFAYTSSGKKLSMSNDEVVEDTYGEPFGVSDVIASYIDFEDDLDGSSIRVSFAKNGTDLGTAFEFSKNDSKEFYPHILVKNVRFECNFGQVETPWSEVKPNYTFTQNIPVSDRIRGSTPVEEKSQCQVVLLSGVNGSGKTSWAKKYMEENSDKHFNLLNAEHVLNKMAIDGKLPVIKDRNDGLMIRVNIALQRLIETAARRRRNFIIDHTNTTRESQVKRQRLFTGYHRIGVVLVPDDDELKRRIEKLEKTENITFPSYWIRDAKAKFYFPQTSSSLEEVLYPELSYDDGKLLYDKARQDYEQYRSSSRYDRRDDYHSSRNNNNNRNRYDDRDRRSREYDRNRDRYARSRSRSRDRDRRTSSREDSRFSSSSSSSHRNENYRGGYSRGGDGRYSDHRQDSRNNQRGGFHDNRGGGGYRGRGGNYNNQSNDDRRGGYQQQQQQQQQHQRNDFGGGRGRGGGNFDNNRGSYHDRQRGGFRQDYGNQSRGRSFNDYDNNQQRQQGGGGGRNFMQNNSNNNFNQQHDRQRFDSRSSMPQQGSFHNQQQPQRSGPLLQNPPSNQQQQQQQQQSYSSHLTQQTANNPNLALQAQNSLNLNALSNAANMTQQNALDPWLALCAAALNTQSTVSQQQQQQQQQPQQDANSLTQQWAQWLKSTQMAQTAQQSQPQLTVQSNESQQAQLSDASALYYQAYYAQLAAAQQQAAAAAAAAAAGPFNGGVAPPGANDK